MNAKRADIQGLRGIAVLAVILCHMNSAWLPGGYLGVDIFFVVSGFVVTTSLLSKPSFNLLDFYLARAKRILPAYYVLLSVVMLTSAVLLVSMDFKLFQESFRSALWFTSNQYFAGYGDYFAPEMAEQPLLHTWSLAVEMQFYLLLPLFLLVFPRRHLLKGLIAIMVTALIYSTIKFSNPINHQSLYYALVGRIPELLAGVILAAAVKNGFSLTGRRTLSWVGFTLILASFMFLDESSYSPLSAMIPVLGTALIILASDGSIIIRNILTGKVIVFLGTISYSLYLWHWPGLAWLKYFDSNLAWSVFSLMLFVFLLILISWLSWLVLEKYADRIDFSRKRIAALSSLFLFIPLSVSVVAKPLNKNMLQLQPDQMEYAERGSICHGLILNECTRGDSFGHKILLIGDSHAAHMNHAMEIVGHNLGIGIDVITASSCTPFLGFNSNKLPGWAQEPCRKQIAYIKTKISDYSTIMLAGKWSYQLKDPDFIRQFRVFLSNESSRIIVFADNPEIDRHPARVHRITQFGFAPSVTIREEVLAANRIIAAEAQGHPNVSWVDISELALFSNPPFFGGELTYSDKHHLNVHGSKVLGYYLTPLIQQELRKNDI